MNRKSTVLLLAIGMIAVTAPTAAAGGTSSNSDTITVFYPTPTVSSAHVYDLGLTADTSIDVTLSWTDEQADLDLFLAPPGGTCLVTNVDCMIESTGDRVRSAACQNDTPGRSVGFGPDSESISTTADGHDSGEDTYSIWVLVSTGVPLMNVNYDLTVTTGDDGHEDLGDGPSPSGLIRSSGHCRGL